MQKQMQLKKVLLAFLVVAPVLAMLALIYRYGINMPYSDDYSLIPMFASLDNGHIPWSLFWEQHNEHRYFFPLIILVTLARLTHWSVLAGLYLSFTVACIGFYGIVILIRRHIPHRNLGLLAIFLSGVFFFSPVQAQNWMWDFQLGWFLCIACIIWSVNLVDKLKREDELRVLVVPAVLAFVATFTLGGGFLAWAGGCMIMLTRRFKLLWLACWVGAGALSLGLYYLGYQLPANGITQGAFMHDIGAFMQYYFAYIGRPIVNDAEAAVLVGSCLTVAFGVVLALTVHKKQLRDMSGVISLGVISAAVGLLIDVARFNYGIGGALSGVHTTFSVLFIVSFIILTTNLVATFKNTNLVIFGMAALAVPIVISSWLTGFADMKAVHKSVTEIYACSREKQPSAECLYRLDSRSPQQAKDGLQYLIKNRYAGY